MPIHPTPDRRTWFSTRADELHRLVERQIVTSITNAQKLAHPWKTNKQETNRKNKETLDRIIDAYVQYINDSAALVPPTITHTHCWQCHVPESPRARPIPKSTLYLCMNQPQVLHTTTTPPRTPPDQPIHRKVLFKPTFQTILGTSDLTPPRVGTKQQRTTRAYLRMLLQARARRNIKAASRVTNTTQSQTQLRKTRAVNPTANEPPQVAPIHTTEPPLHSDSDSSTDLYFRAQANHRPEMGESNAESVLREEKINKDVK